eukprot:GEMP01137656.1.p1 GENE.GEMP01137656.1~~GEMP01137656.1.p1  ORF type:complete len:105 (+),score=6.72 GEMP01137656.1:74-388(+)
MRKRAAEFPRFLEEVSEQNTSQNPGYLFAKLSSQRRATWEMMRIDSLILGFPNKNDEIKKPMFDLEKTHHSTNQERKRFFEHTIPPRRVGRRSRFHRFSGFNNS